MTQPEPPLAKQIPVTRTHHGDNLVDEYEWLRDKDSPDTCAYLEAENAYTQARTAHLDGLRQRIFEEIKSRTQETDLSVPYRIGGHWYYGRTQEGKQYAVSCRCPVSAPDDWTPPAVDGLEPGAELPGEQVLLDANRLAEGHEFFALGASTISPDGSLLAYSTDVEGNERYTLRVRDLRTGADLPDEVPNTLGSPAWDLHATTLFYTTVDEAWRPDTVWRHPLGHPVTEDVVVRHEADERFWLSVGRTRSDRFLLIGAGSTLTSEYALLEAGDPTGEFRVVAPRREGVEYGVEHARLAGRDCLLVLHNDGAQNFMVSVAPVDATSHEQWTPLLAHDPAVRLEDVDAFATHLVVSQRSGGLSRLRVIMLDDAGRDGLGEEFLVELGDPVFSIGAGGNPEFAQPTVRFGYTTMATPPGVYDFDVTTHESTLLKAMPVLPDPDGVAFDPGRYEQHREWAKASDSTLVPISLVVPKGAPRDGSMPLVLYGYGAYEHSSEPAFSLQRLSLLDRGVGYAIAHVRGGGELGRHWYEDGKMLHKRNTFTDFVACAEHLVDTGWTSSDRLAADGGSAGGLLMGAVANLAPEAFAAICAHVPFVDALTTILDPSLPLTVVEWEEWGNPLEDPDAYAYMKGYSPYENLRPTRYPAILALTSLHDTRVLYVEPAKWVARMRQVITNPDDVLLRTEMAAGHGGVSGRYTAWRQRAFALAWLLDRLDRADPRENQGHPLRSP